MPTSIPPSQGDALRPVLHELGKALYIAQQFETNLLYLVALLSSQDGTVTATSFKSGLRRPPNERTLGGLWSRFAVQLRLSSEHEGDIMQFMRAGIDVRNAVVHGYVRRNAADFRTRSGRQRLVDDLKKSQCELNRRLVVVSSALDKALGVFGGSLEKLAAQADFAFEADFLGEATYFAAESLQGMGRPGSRSPLV